VRERRRARAGTGPDVQTAHTAARDVRSGPQGLRDVRRRGRAEVPALVPELGAAGRDAVRRRRRRRVVERRVVPRVQRAGDRQRQRHRHVHAEQLVDERPRQPGPAGRGAPVLESERGHRGRGQTQSVRVRRPVGDTEERRQPSRAVRQVEEEEEDRSRAKREKGRAETGGQTEAGRRPGRAQRTGPGEGNGQGSSQGGRRRFAGGPRRQRGRGLVDV